MENCHLCAAFNSRKQQTHLLNESLKDKYDAVMPSFMIKTVDRFLHSKKRHQIYEDFLTFYKEE